jgi:hypothetical protein
MEDGRDSLPASRTHVSDMYDGGTLEPGAGLTRALARRQDFNRREVEAGT